MTPDPLSDGAASALSAAIPSLGEGYFAAPLSPLASKLRHNAVSSAQAWNAFVYVTGSPATRIDPSGLCGEPCDPTLDPNCVCDPTTDPFCGCDPTFGPDCGGGCGADRPCRCNPAVDPTCGGGGLFLLFLHGGGGLGRHCPGTTSCSYYQAACARATTPWAKNYYCHVAPAACAEAGTLLGNGPLTNCIRLCLQRIDNCEELGNPIAFYECIDRIHGICGGACFTWCQLR